MDKLNFDEFLEEVWDYVSEYLISDKFWEDNAEYIRELTFDVYRIYERSYHPDYQVYMLTPRVCGKLLEIFIHKSEKYNFLKLNNER